MYVFALYRCLEDKKEAEEIGAKACKWNKKLILG